MNQDDVETAGSTDEFYLAIPDVILIHPFNFVQSLFGRTPWE